MDDHLKKKMNFDVPRDPTRNKSFLIWEDTYFELIKIVNDIKPKNFLEIGVAGGQNILNLSKYTQVNSFIGVDSYDPKSWDMSRDMIINNFGNFDNLYFEVNNLLEKLTFGRTKLIRKRSIQAAQEIKNKSIDCIFIDADHSFRSVFKDIIFWFPKVSKNGYLMGHDYNHPTHIGTTKAVKLLLGRVLLGADNSYIWFININHISKFRKILLKILNYIVKFF